MYEVLGAFMDYFRFVKFNVHFKNAIIFLFHFQFSLQHLYFRLFLCCHAQNQMVPRSTNMICKHFYSTLKKLSLSRRPTVFSKSV